MNIKYNIIILKSKYCPETDLPWLRVCALSASCSIHATTILGKLADLTVVQMTIDILHKESKPQKVITEKAGLLRALYRSILMEERSVV